MGRLYIEVWSQYFNKTEKLSHKEKVGLLLFQFSILARFLFIAGLILLLTGVFLNCLTITIIGIVLLSALLISLAIDTKKSKINDPLSNIDFVRNRAQIMVPQFLEYLQISHSELPMVLKCIKEYYEVQIAKEKSVSEKLFDFSICGLVASCLVLALEFFKGGFFWMVLSCTSNMHPDPILGIMRFSNSMGGGFSAPYRNRQNQTDNSLSGVLPHTRIRQKYRIAKQDRSRGIGAILGLSGL